MDCNKITHKVQMKQTGPGVRVSFKRKTPTLTPGQNPDSDSDSAPEQVSLKSIH